MDTVTTGNGGRTTASSEKLIAELNDLLQLDHDAVAAYTLALNLLQDLEYLEAVRSFRADHERHIEELTYFIRLEDGIPIQLPHVTGAFKLAIQGLGAVAGDAAVIAAFKANERQSRDKYASASAGTHSPQIREAIRRAAQDEERHYNWAVRALTELGSIAAETGGMVGALEDAHAATANVVERVERGAMQLGERFRRVAKRAGPITVVATGLMVVGLGAAVSVLLKKRK